MSTTADSFTTVARSQLESALKVAATAADGAERLAEAQIRVLRAGFDSGLSQLQAFAALKNPAELQGLAATFLHPSTDTLGACARDLTDALQVTRAEVTRAVEAQVTGMGSATAALVQSALGHAPAGSETAVATLRQLLDQGQGACVAAIKSFNGVVEAVESQVAGLSPTPARRKKAA